MLMNNTNQNNTGSLLDENKQHLNELLMNHQHLMQNQLLPSNLQQHQQQQSQYLGFTPSAAGHLINQHQQLRHANLNNQQQQLQQTQSHQNGPLHPQMKTVVPDPNGIFFGDDNLDGDDQSFQNHQKGLGGGSAGVPPFQKELFRTKRSYVPVEFDKRSKLIKAVEEEGLTIKEAAQNLKINYSTAKHIVKVYKRTGEIQTQQLINKRLPDRDIRTLEAFTYHNMGGKVGTGAPGMSYLGGLWPQNQINQFGQQAAGNSFLNRLGTPNSMFLGGNGIQHPGQNSSFLFNNNQIAGSPASLAAVAGSSSQTPLGNNVTHLSQMGQQQQQQRMPFNAHQNSMAQSLVSQHANLNANGAATNNLFANPYFSQGGAPHNLGYATGTQQVVGGSNLISSGCGAAGTNQFTNSVTTHHPFSMNNFGQISQSSNINPDQLLPMYTQNLKRVKTSSIDSPNQLVPQFLFNSAAGASAGGITTTAGAAASQLQQLTQATLQGGAAATGVTQQSNIIQANANQQQQSLANSNASRINNPSANALQGLAQFDNQSCQLATSVSSGATSVPAAMGILSTFNNQPPATSSNNPASGSISQQNQMGENFNSANGAAFTLKVQESSAGFNRPATTSNIISSSMPQPSSEATLFSQLPSQISQEHAAAAGTQTAGKPQKEQQPFSLQVANNLPLNINTSSTSSPVAVAEVPNSIAGQEFNTSAFTTKIQSATKPEPAEQQQINNAQLQQSQQPLLPHQQAPQKTTPSSSNNNTASLSAQEIPTSSNAAIMRMPTPQNAIGGGSVQSFQSNLPQLGGISGGQQVITPQRQNSISGISAGSFQQLQNPLGLSAAIGGNHFAQSQQHVPPMQNYNHLLLQNSAAANLLMQQSAAGQSQHHLQSMMISQQIQRQLAAANNCSTLISSNKALNSTMHNLSNQARNGLVSEHHSMLFPQTQQAQQKGSSATIQFQNTSLANAQGGAAAAQMTSSSVNEQSFSSSAANAVHANQVSQVTAQVPQQQQQALNMNTQSLYNPMQVPSGYSFLQNQRYPINASQSIAGAARPQLLHNSSSQLIASEKQNTQANAPSTHGSNLQQ